MEFPIPSVFWCVHFQVYRLHHNTFVAWKDKQGYYPQLIKTRLIARYSTHKKLNCWRKKGKQRKRKRQEEGRKQKKITAKKIRKMPRIEWQPGAGFTSKSLTRKITGKLLCPWFGSRKTRCIFHTLGQYIPHMGTIMANHKNARMVILKSWVKFSAFLVLWSWRSLLKVERFSKTGDSNIYTGKSRLGNLEFGYIH